MSNSIILALYITNKCNLSCNYCFAKKGNEVMDMQLATKSIDYLVQKKKFDIIPTFLGGEPLIEWPLIKGIVAFSEIKGINKFNLATNGLLVDEEKIDYFLNHNFKIQLSFDGIRESQDYSRRKINGSDTFQELHKRLQLFLKYSNKISLELRMTITTRNLEFLAQSIIFLLKEGFRTSRINIMPVIRESWRGVDFSRLKREIKAIKEYYGVLKIIPNIHINECIDKRNANISHLTDDCSCGFGSRVICVDYNGKVYSCFIPAGLEESEKNRFLIGDLDKGIVFNKFYNRNEFLSCPIWTSLYGNKAVDIYKRIYETWTE